MADADVFTISTHELAEVRANLAQAATTLTGEHQLRAMRLRDFLESFDPQENAKLRERIAALEDDLADVARIAPLQPIRDAVADAFKDARWGANIGDMVLTRSRTGARRSSRSTSSTPKNSSPRSTATSSNASNAGSKTTSFPPSTNSPKTSESTHDQNHPHRP